MIRKTLIIVSIILQIGVFISSAAAEYESIYHYYIQEGIEAFYKNDFENAVFYFKTAHAIDPLRAESLQYLNLVKREQESRLIKPSSESDVPKNLMQDLPTLLEKDPPVHKTSVSTKSTIIDDSSLKQTEKPSITQSQTENLQGSLMPQTERSFTIIEPTIGIIKHFADKEDFKLTDDLWLRHSQMTLEIEIDKSVVFVGKDIKRYLATLEELLEITRIDKDRIRVKALKRGNAIFYIWDDRGRWAFNLHCVYPFENQDSGGKSFKQEQASPFRLGYTNSWSTVHKGSDISHMSRQYIIFTNWFGIDGETPYGKLGASINTYMFAASTEIVGQHVGLIHGHIGPFKDFSIYGYDAYKSLSDLTVAGRNFRGFLIDSYAFDHQFAYSYFRGQDQTVSIYSSTGSVEKRQSYVEGLKLVMHPDQETNQYAINLARGHGAARPTYLEDHVYSIETKQKFHDVAIHGELGYDSDEFASLVHSEYKQNDLDVNFNLRDVNPNYSTLFGAPINSGQAGASLNISVKPSEYRWDTFLDVYRDRIQPNLDNPNLVNLDFSTAYSRPIDELSNWGAFFGYINTPQTLSARQFMQLGTTYSKSIKVGKLRFLSLSLGQSMQWSRYDDSPSSDYDRYGLRAGMRYKLFKYLYYSMNYEYILVHDIFNDRWSSPTAFQAGLDYSAPITDRISFNYGLNYRNEQQSQSSFSFLAGEDSLMNNFSLSYQPVNDVSIFLDSQLRRVWPQQNTSTSAYYDLNLMLGLRSKWDLPFRWNPTGEVQGIVYKDYNGNALQDKNEIGIPGIKVIVGKYETVTNENGEYSIKVSAKKATVSLDLQTIPTGFVFSTALTRDVIIEHKKAVRVNFGLSSRSGIYGVAFLDINDSGKPDRGDKFISNVVIRLDSGEITKTDFSGSYFFENVNPGKHTIRIDVNSIPMMYSPLSKITMDVDLKEGTTYVYNIPLKENPDASKP